MTYGYIFNVLPENLRFLSVFSKGAKPRVKNKLKSYVCFNDNCYVILVYKKYIITKLPVTENAVKW